MNYFSQKLDQDNLEFRYLPQQTSFDAVRFWNKVGLDLVQEKKSGPTIGSRVYGVLNSAIYDAWAAYDRRALGSVVDLDAGLIFNTTKNKNTSISYSAASVLSSLFPNDLALINQKLKEANAANFNSLLFAPRGRAMRLGMTVGTKVADYFLNDGANQANGYADTTRYTPVNTPDTVSDKNRWQPLLVNGVVQKALTPHWGTVKGFALTSGSQFRPSAPPLYPSQRFQAEVQQVFNLRNSLTDREKAIAEYWEFGPGTPFPPGKWLQIADSIAEQNGYNLDTNAKLFFTLSHALQDAGIAAWDAKYAYDSVRPITAVREILGQKEFKPYLGTPAFPEFVSGHSTFSSAAAEVLMQFTGSNRYNGTATLAAGSSRYEPGGFAQDITLSWPYFSDAADEAGFSRICGGIHFESGDIQGRILGRKVATEVASKAFALFQGKTDFRMPFELKFGDNGDNTLDADLTGVSRRGQLVGAKLYGYGGNDTLWGGLNRQELFGGEGSDTFVLRKDCFPDIIRDFNPNQGDRVAISQSSFGAVGSVGSTIDLSNNPVFKFEGASSCLLYRGCRIAVLDGVDSLSQISVVL